MACKTGELGYTVTRCPDCGHTEMHACACGNRNCPSCGYLKEQQWVEERRHEILPDIPYFHITFTLPHELSQLIYQNQIETLNLLFRSAKETILDLSRDKLKMVPGILMVLHTSGSNLSLHYHLHVLVSGGGLTLDKKQFKRCMANKFFLPARAGPHRPARSLSAGGNGRTHRQPRAHRRTHGGAHRQSRTHRSPRGGGVEDRLL